MLPTESPLPRLANPDDVVAWAQRLVEDLARRWHDTNSTVNGLSGGGSSTAEPYVVMALSGALSDERQLAVDSGELTLTDGGPGSTASLGLATSGVVAGSYGSATQVPALAVDAFGRVTSVTNTTISGVAPGGAAGGDLTGTYPNPSVVDDSHNHTASTLTGVVKTGDAAGGDLSGTYPNPSVVDDSHSHAIGTSITGLGANVATFLATPSSANLSSAVTDETGTGALVFANTPTLVTPILGTPTSGTLTNCTGLPIATGVSGLGANVATFLATPSSANLRSALTDETGTGAAVFADTPTLVTPILGTPTSGTLTNCTGLPISTGVSGLGANVATFLATPSSANLRGALTDETGTGAAVFADTPTLVTPVLGTPTSGTLTNCTGLPVSTGISGLGSGVATWLATPSSANLAAAVTGETGSGALVFGTQPTFTTDITTPIIYGGTATATNLDLWANNNTWDYSNAGRIRLNERVTFTGSWTDTDFDIKLIETTQAFTLSAGSILAGLTGFNFAPTLAYQNSLLIGFCPTFRSNMQFRPTASVNDTGLNAVAFTADHSYVANAAAITPQGLTIAGYWARPGLRVATGTSVTMTDVVGYVTNYSTDAANGIGSIGTNCTATNYMHYWARPPAKAGTITNEYGLRIDALTGGGTLIAGVASAIAQGSGKWGLLFTGDADNSIEGGLRLGTDSGVPDTVLHIAPNSASTARRAAITWEEDSATPSNPTSGSQMRVYLRADKFIIQFNDGGTVRYKYLDLTGTGVTWTHTTTAPT